jgi:hypothetical protein
MRYPWPQIHNNIVALKLHQPGKDKKRCSFIYLWDLHQNKVINRRRATVIDRGLIFAYGGKALAACSGNTLKLWGIEDLPTCTRPLAISLPSRSALHSSIALDAQRCAGIGLDAVYIVRRTNDPIPDSILEQTLPIPHVSTLQLSSDQEHIIAAQVPQSGTARHKRTSTITMWHLTTAQKLHTTTIRDETCIGLHAMTPDHYLVTTDSAIRLYKGDHAQGFSTLRKILLPFTQEGQEYLSMSPRGAYVLSQQRQDNGDKEKEKQTDTFDAIIHNTRSRTRVATLPAAGHFLSLASEHCLMAVSKDKTKLTIYRWPPHPTRA